MEEETITVHVRVPLQIRSFKYSKSEWDQAIERGEVAYLMDHDLSDWFPDKNVFDPYPPFKMLDIYG